MLSRRRAVAVLVVGLVGLVGLAGGCTMQPLYGTRSDEQAGLPLAAVFSATRIEPLNGREGLILRRRLVTLFHANGRRTTPRWRLSLVLREEQRDFSIRLDETAARRRLRFYAEWQFDPIDGTQEGAQSWSGQVSSSVAYDVVTSAFATEVAAEAARAAALEHLAEEVIQDLALALAGQV